MRRLQQLLPSEMKPLKGLGLTLLALCAVVDLATGLKCYACSSVGTLDPRCEKDPASVPGLPIITCALKYCTIRRVEYVDPEGILSSFFRGCEERPLYTNKVVTSGNFITSYRACQADLCNADDGTASIDTGEGGGGGWLDNGQWGGSDGGLVLAPGLGAAGAITHNVVLLAGALGALGALAMARRGG